MHKPYTDLHRWIYLTIAGFTLMNVALFLHPMSPDDFFMQAFSNPVSTILDSQGADMAIFFWASLIIFGIGVVVSCLFIIRQFKHRFLPKIKPSLNTFNKLAN